MAGDPQILGALADLETRAVRAGAKAQALTQELATLRAYVHRHGDQHTSEGHDPFIGANQPGHSHDHGTQITGLLDNDHTQYTLKAILTAKGSLYVATAAATPADFPVGTNDNIIMADSAQASGMKWAAPGTPSTQAFGDSAAEGTTDGFTRTDHKHAMPANPVTAHEGAADPHTGYVLESSVNWIDLTDGGATTLHTHSGGGTTHDILSATHTDALAAAVARGDILYGNATPKWARLAKPAAAAILMHDGTDVAWAYDAVNGRIYVDSAGRLVALRDGSYAVLQATSYSNTAGDAGFLSLQHARGTLAVPLATANANYLGEIDFNGYVSGGFVLGASILAVASQAWSAGNQGTGLYFVATPYETATPLTCLALPTTAWRMLYGNASGQLTEVVLGAVGTYWRSAGAAAPPGFSAIPAAEVTIADAGGDFTATDVEGALDELQADNEAHVAAADPHTGYRLESADHSHASTGAQGGTLAHKVSKSIIFASPSAALAASEDWLPDQAVRVPAASKHGTWTPGTFYVRLGTASSSGSVTVLFRTSDTLAGARTTRATVTITATNREGSAAITWTPADGQYMWVECTGFGTGSANGIAQVDIEETIYT